VQDAELSARHASVEVSDASAVLAMKAATSLGIRVTILIAVAMALVIKHTVFGTYVCALGSNKDAAHLSLRDSTTAIGKEFDVVAAAVAVIRARSYA
tara:strand:- start:34 stop:324 length:291 start_codon:yes stop_codon:yes gene_type:complete